MRNILTVIIIFGVTVVGYSQSPQKMSYQAVIRNSSDQLVTNHAIGMRICILQGSSGGTPVYVETQTPTSNANGLVTIEIGSGAIVSGTFDSIDWSSGTYFIKTETDPAGGTSYTIAVTSQLLSVPYALYAITAGTSDALQSQINMLKNSMAGEGMVADYENNVYNTIKIGTQVWMAENLRATKYNDGTIISNITVNAEWAALTTGAYCWYNNDETNKNIRGAVYNWYAVDNNALTKVASNGGKNICPTGWHVPKDAEWITLTDYLTNNGYGYEGSGSDIGKSMASKSGWTPDPYAGNVGNDQASNNSSWFTAIPSGLRAAYVSNSIFLDSNRNSDWWSSTEYSATDAYHWVINCSNSGVYGEYIGKRYGLSVRCLRD